MSVTSPSDIKLLYTTVSIYDFLRETFKTFPKRAYIHFSTTQKD